MDSPISLYLFLGVLPADSKMKEAFFVLPELNLIIPSTKNLPSLFLIEAVLYESIFEYTFLRKLSSSSSNDTSSTSSISSELSSIFSSSSFERGLITSFSSSQQSSLGSTSTTILPSSSAFTSVLESFVLIETSSRDSLYLPAIT